MDAVQLAWLIGALVFALWVLGAYNRLVSLRTAIGQAWARVEEPLRLRELDATALVQRLRTQLADGHSTLDAVVATQAQLHADLTALRGRPLQQRAALAALVAHDIACTEALASLHAAVQADPALRSDAHLGATLAEFVRLDARLADARERFNEAGQAYDRAIAQFPTRVIVPLFGFRRAGRF
jgi:LemA protein